MGNTRKVVVAQIKVGDRVVYENVPEMNKIRYNHAIAKAEEKLADSDLKEAKEVIAKIMEKK